jgi:hypothetical protein
VKVIVFISSSYFFDNVNYILIVFFRAIVARRRFNIIIHVNRFNYPQVISIAHGCQ